MPAVSGLRARRPPHSAVYLPAPPGVALPSPARCAREGLCVPVVATQVRQGRPMVVLVSPQPPGCSGPLVSVVEETW